MSVLRQHVRFGKVHADFRRQDQVHAAGHRLAAFVSSQALAGEVDRHQRPRTRSVYGHTRPGEPQQIRNAAGGHAENIARRGVGVNLLGVLKRQPVIVAVAQRQKHARAALRKAQRIVAGVLKCLPRHLKRKTMLGIENHGFARRNSEKIRVEQCGIRNQRSAAHVHLSRRVRIRIVVVLERPAGGWNFRHRLGSINQQLPELFRRRYRARESQAHADDRDRFSALTFQFFHAAAQLPDLVHGALGGTQLFDGIVGGCHHQIRFNSAMSSSSASASESAFSSSSAASGWMGMSFGAGLVLRKSARSPSVG